MNPLDEFKDLGDYYPGSKRKWGSIPETRPELTLEDTIGRPRTYTVKGESVDFFSSGQLAKALNRKAVTIRAWESNGVIPKPKFKLPSEHKQGVRRLYSREQVLGMIQIAEEEGILHETWKPIGRTQFTKRVIELFQGSS